jgi:DNA-binding beta-propeller fold protein YncE
MSSSRRRFLKTAAAAPIILGAADKAGVRRPIVGAGDHQYEVIHDWGELPARIQYGNTHGVCEDSQGRIYVHHTVNAASESADSMVVFDAQGKFIKSWGKEFKGGAHGLHIRKEGSTEFLYLCDKDRGVVVKTTVDGEEVFTLGYPKESEPYRAGIKYSPTNLAIAPNGDIYVGDGYGSNYINQYNHKGEFIRTFGGKGSGAGELACPHGITIDTRGPEPLILVADRSNNRLQYFSLDGKHVKFAGGVVLPCHFHERNGEMVIPDLAARVTIVDRNNEVIVHLGQGADDWRVLRTKSRDAFIPGKFICPHGACFDHEGNIFVVEWVEVGRVTKLRKV